MLVAAMNPCRCGRAERSRLRSAGAVHADRCAADYQARLSGPLLDRIDLTVELPALTAADLCCRRPRRTADGRGRVAPGPRTSGPTYATSALPACAPMPRRRPAVLEEAAKPERAGVALLREAAEAMRLSARGYHRRLRVARYARGSRRQRDTVSRLHVAEALSYRSWRRSAASRQRTA